MKIWKEGNMRIGIKDKHELNLMREGGKILGLILHELAMEIEPGITTLELDTKAEELMKKYKVKPSFKGYKGFPNVICACINEEVVHGIPNNRKLKEGDIITIDCGVIHGDFHTDSAITIGVGKIDPKTEKFIKTCEKALSKAIETVRPGIRVRDISKIIQKTIEKNGYSVIRDLIGHGIGHNLHEDPQIPNFVDDEPGPILQAGMTIAIEPIISMGNYGIKLLHDGWTYVTKDGSLSAQVEHSIAITEKGAEILTKRPL